MYTVINIDINPDSRTEFMACIDHFLGEKLLGIFMNYMLNPVSSPEYALWIVDSSGSVSKLSQLSSSSSG